MAVQESDVKGILKDALPVLADYQGKLELNQSQVPPELLHVFEQFTAAVRGGARLIFLDLRSNRSDSIKEQAYKNDQDMLVPDADFYQFLHRGLLQSDSAKGFSCISPDDRQASYGDVSSKIKNFEHTVTSAEEGDGKLFAYGEKGKIVVLTHETARMINGHEKFNSK